MSDIAALIDRLERADGPDRELDADIDVALFGGETIWKQANYTMEQYPASRRPSKNHVGGFANEHVPLVTASIDAALALVEKKLPGWVVSVCHCHISDDAWLAPDFNDPAHSERLWREFGQVPGDPTDYWQQLTDVALHPPRGIAIAACISLLRALQAQEPRHDD